MGNSFSRYNQSSGDIIKDACKKITVNGGLHFGWDIETDYDEKNKEVFVFQWALINEEHKIDIVGCDLPSFFECLSTLYLKYRKPLIIHAHNGSKFDFDFLTDFGTRYFQDPKEWHVILNGRNTTACLWGFNDTYMSKRTGKEEPKFVVSAMFLDTFKFFQTSLAEVAPCFGLKKLDPPWTIYDGWSKQIDLQDPTNWEYVRQDARIAYRMAHFIHIEQNVGSWASSSMAIKKFTEMIPEMRSNKLEDIQHGKQEFEKLESKFKQYFPHPDTEEKKDLVYNACTGGHIEVYKKGRYSNVRYYDINSAYCAAAKLMEYPIGFMYVVNYPKKEELEKYLWIARLNISVNLKKGCKPTLHVKDKESRVNQGLEVCESIQNTKEGTGIWVYWTKYDWENYSRNYTIKINSLKSRSVFDPLKEETFTENQRYLIFKADVATKKVGADFANKYFELKNECKQRAKQARSEGNEGEAQKQKALEQYYKLYPNGFSGRTNLKPKNVFDIHIKDNDIVAPFDTEEPAEEFPSYSAPQIYAFVTSWARKVLDTLIINGDILSCHTDSVKTLYEVPQEFLDNKELGKFKDELDGQSFTDFWQFAVNKSIGVINGETLDNFTTFNNLKITFTGFNTKMKIDTDIPINNAIYEIIDRRYELLEEEIEIGKEHYKIIDENLRKLAVKNGANPDDLDTRCLYFQRCKGGRRAIKKAKKTKTIWFGMGR